MGDGPAWRSRSVGLSYTFSQKVGQPNLTWKSEMAQIIDPLYTGSDVYGDKPPAALRLVDHSERNVAESNSIFD